VMSTKKRKLISKDEENEESKAKVWRWGILSTGKIAQDFVTALKDVKSATVVAVGSRSLEDAKSFAKRFNIPSAYGSYEELVEDEEVDVIYVGTPHIFHKDNITLALSHKKHVLCEKPLTINQQEAKQVVALAKEKNLFLMEALWSRYIPFMVKIRSILAEGVIGDVKLVEANFGFKAEREIRRLWEPALAGGATLDIGIYPLTLASMVYGGGLPSQILVAGELSDTKVDEAVAVTLKYGKGELATLNFNIGAPLNNIATITGTNGRIHLHGPFWHATEKITLAVTGKEEEVFNFPIPSEGRSYNFHNSAALRHEAEEVHRCLEAKLVESAIMPLQESLNVMAIMDHIRACVGVTYPTEKEAPKKLAKSSL